MWAVASLKPSKASTGGRNGAVATTPNAFACRPISDNWTKREAPSASTAPAFPLPLEVESPHRIGHSGLMLLFCARFGGLPANCDRGETSGTVGRLDQYLNPRPQWTVSLVVLVFTPSGMNTRASPRVVAV